MVNLAIREIKPAVFGKTWALSKEEKQVLLGGGSSQSIKKICSMFKPFYVPVRVSEAKALGIY